MIVFILDLIVNLLDKHLSLVLGFVLYDLLQLLLPDLQVLLTHQVRYLASLGYLTRILFGVNMLRVLHLAQWCVADGVGKEGGLWRRRRRIVNGPDGVAGLEVDFL